MAADPGTAFPAGDPRNALYFETIGKLEHQRDQTKTENERLLGTERAAATYKQGQLTQQEPGTYGANRFRAVREGIASSGVNSERRGGIAKNYADRRFAVTKSLGDREGALARSTKAAEDRYAEGARSAGTHALAEGAAYLERNPPAPAAPAGPSAAELAGGYTVGTTGEHYTTVRPYAEQRAAIKWSRDPRVKAEQERRGY